MVPKLDLLGGYLERGMTEEGPFFTKHFAFSERWPVFRLKPNTSPQYLVAQCLQMLQYQFPRSNMEHSEVTYINTLLFGFVDIVSLLAFQANLLDSKIISNNKNNIIISKMFTFPQLKCEWCVGWVLPPMFSMWHNAFKCLSVSMGTSCVSGTQLTSSSSQSIHWYQSSPVVYNLNPSPMSRSWNFCHSSQQEAATEHLRQGTM